MSSVNLIASTGAETRHFHFGGAHTRGSIALNRRRRSGRWRSSTSEGEIDEVVDRSCLKHTARTSFPLASCRGSATEAMNREQVEGLVRRGRSVVIGFNASVYMFSRTNTSRRSMIPNIALSEELHPNQTAGQSTSVRWFHGCISAKHSIISLDSEKMREESNLANS
jgi:hypothetical protein